MAMQPVGIRRMVLATALMTTSACASPAPATPAPTPACEDPPDAYQTLAQAWRAYQPDQPLSPAVSVRRRLFAFQALLLSAGMYDDQAPSDPGLAYAQYAPQFVRDFGKGRDPGMSAALDKLASHLHQVRERSEADLGASCGLVVARRALRADPVNVATDWVLQTITWGLAATFQASIHEMVHEHARACSSQPDVDGTPESVLTCTMRRVGI